MRRLLKLTLQKPETGRCIAADPDDYRLSGEIQFHIPQSMTTSAASLVSCLKLALVAIGVTLLMIAGEFDLSVGSVFALAPMCHFVLMTMGWGFWPAMAVGLLACVAVGLINGWVTIHYDIPSFITTLGMMFMARSMTVVVSGGFPPRVDPSLIPSELFSAYVGPGEIFRASFLWFVAMASDRASAAVTHQLRQLGPCDWRLHARRARHGHPHGTGKDRLFHDLFDAGGFCRDDSGDRGSSSPLPSIGEGYGVAGRCRCGDRRHGAVWRHRVDHRRHDRRHC